MVVCYKTIDKKYANPKGDVKDEDGFLGHLDGVSAKTVDDIVEGDIAAAFRSS